ncbi:ferrous iron transport protein B [Leeia sp.]|uniref:ferrous iron transport protein B n=1 Tax=Leeia sp. TaxID=2884678 RepID=UPI0035AD798B
MRMLEIALIGNPNCGKTSLFNQLTGSQQTVGNWPGVTVERKTGRLILGGVSHELVDLPGLYNLSEGGAEDEALVRRYLGESAPALVLNLLDARQLDRQLYLTLQLIEMGLPLIVLLGMSDLAAQDGIQIDAPSLSARLGVPVIPVMAHRAEGVAALRQQLQQSWPSAPPALPYAPMVEAALSGLLAQGMSRFDALSLLEGREATPALQAEVTAARQQLAADYGDDPDIAVADARYTRIAQVTEGVLRRQGAVLPERGLDRWVLNRWLGVPVFMLVMYLMFSFSVRFGGALVDAFDGVAGALFVTGAGQLLHSMHAPDWLVLMLAGGLGEGVRTVAGFIPTLACLYLAMGVLEDCGYLARAAFVIDRLMRALGLPGRAFVPMMVGFGCNVPAITATRTLDSRASRILASMMIPFMSCGARLPVYMLFATAFFPQQGGMLVMSLYLAGLAVALATGLLLRPLLPQQGAPSIMELPRWHWPNARNVLRQSLTRLSGFVFGAGKLIVPMVLVVNLLSSIDTQGHLRPDAPDDSLLAATSRLATPLLSPLGIRQDNWPATVGLLTGVLAKEAVAGTLVASYSRLSGKQDSEGGEATVTGDLRNALATIPANLNDLAHSLLDPIGLGKAISDSQAQADEAGGAIQMLQQRFGNAQTAFAYLLLVLLYTPCVAALSALRSEVGTRWMLVSAVWTLSVAWLLAWLYQCSAAVIGVIPLWAVAGCLLLLTLIGFVQPQRQQLQRA